MIKTLDLGYIFENEEYWFEEINTQCPYCDGEGEYTEHIECEECEGMGANECEECDGSGRVECPNECDEGYMGKNPCPTCDDGAPDGTVECLECEDGEVECDYCSGTGEYEDTEYCEHCSDGHMEILWNTGYHVPYLLNELTWHTARKIAADMGYVLFEWENEYWLGMCGCGQDNSWRTAYTVLELSGYLPYEYANWMSEDAHVFLSDEKARKLSLAALEAIDNHKKHMVFTNHKYTRFLTWGNNYFNKRRTEQERIEALAEEYMAQSFKYRLLTWVRVAKAKVNVLARKYGVNA